MPELVRAEIAAIGEAARIEGYALAGVVTVPAADPSAARRAWDGLADTVGVVILTRDAADALGAGLIEDARGARLTVVLPV